MLPSKQRLSRLEFTQFLASKDIKTVFNQLGTLKYRKSLINNGHTTSGQASIVISSKHEKSAVCRNKLRRRLYSLFKGHFKDNNDYKQYLLYVSKQAKLFDFNELKSSFYELFKKTTK